MRAGVTSRPSYKKRFGRRRRDTCRTAVGLKKKKQRETTSLSLKMKSLSVLAVLVSVVLADDNATSTSTTTLAPTLEATTLESVQKEKIARRIIDERLSPPRASEFGSWSGKKLSLGEVHRISGPRVTEVIEDDVTDKPITKKSRNVGPSQGEFYNKCLRFSLQIIE